jgi:CBS domain containing-hemolysin-like protein
MNPGELIWTVVGFLLTVMVLSYLIGDNVFFRLAAYLFVGLTTGYLAVLLINQVLWPHLIQPLASGNWTNLLWGIIPAVLALLLILGQIPKLSGLKRVPLAFLVGLTAAIAVGGAVFGTLIPQARAVISGFDPAAWYAVPETTWLRIIDAVVMLLGTVSVLSTFHFGRKLKPKAQEEQRERPLVLEGLSKVGQVFMGITLGAIFAGVFSTALLALIDRMAFLGEAFRNIIGGL